MHRPGCDPEGMEAEDFLCDFCGAHWREDLPMVEGHRGSLICGACLTRACEQVLVRNAGVVVPEHVACALCLMNKSGDFWQSPRRAEVLASEQGGKGSVQVHEEPGACVCRWCIDRSAGMLAKDAESGWKRPG